jgi:hypothetical protein
LGNIQNANTFAGVGSREASSRGLQNAVFSSQSLFNKPGAGGGAGGQNPLQSMLAMARGEMLGSRNPQTRGAQMQAVQPGSTIATVGNPGGSAMPPSGPLGQLDEELLG